MSEQQQPVVFDSPTVRTRHARSAGAGDMPDFLHKTAAHDIKDRFAAILRDFNNIAVSGDHGGELAGIVPGGRITTLNVSAAGRCQPDLVCDQSMLPFADGCLDGFISLFGLECIDDLPGALVQIRRSLKPDGVFLAALLGGDTFVELRRAWLSAESELTGGVTPRVAPFASVPDLGGLLQRAGFALPVADSDRLTVRYANALDLMREIKRLGLSNPLKQRSRTPVTRELLARAAAHYEADNTDPDGRIRATFEIVYLTGWCPHESQPKALKPGSAKTRLADALGTREYIVKRER